MFYLSNFAAKHSLSGHGYVQKSQVLHFALDYMASIKVFEEQNRRWRDSNKSGESQSGKGENESKSAIAFELSSIEPRKE